MAHELDNQIWLTLADEHRRWLSPFNPQYLENWKKQVKANPEAAMSEASIRRRLQRWGMTVEPNEALSGNCGGPDFRCSCSCGHFYVEVTCIQVETAERRFGMDRNARVLAAFDLWGMVQAVFNECQNKAPQCGGLDGPALVAVCTFHKQAAQTGLRKVLIEGLLTGRRNLAWDIDIEDADGVGDSYEVTGLQSSAFLRLDSKEELQFARSSISAVLICKLGFLPEQYLGVLHPNPARPFDPSILPRVECASIEIDKEAARLRVSWTGGGGDY